MPKGILRSLLTDVNRLLPGTEGLGRDLVTLEARIEHEGVAFMASALGALDAAVLNGLTSGTFLCPPGFKRRSGEAIPVLFSGMLEKVFDVNTGQLEEGDCVEVISLLRQLLLFLEEGAPTRVENCEALDKAYALLHRNAVFIRRFDSGKETESRMPHNADLVGFRFPPRQSTWEAWAGRRCRRV